MSASIPPITSFAQARQVLATYWPRNSGQRHSNKLDDMQHLLAHVGNPQQQLRVIHVAGTSGKTSTAYYTAALLCQAGLKVGLTISPHVDEINERVQLNMQPLSERAFCNELTQFLTLLQSSPVRPTYFELMVAFALWYFAKQGVNYAVVEVGIGGLLDSTNVITNPDKVCVITDIGLDHTKILGKTLSEIAAQKAGIIHANNPVFCYDQDNEVMRPIRQRAIEKRADLHIVPQVLPPQIDFLPRFQQRNFGLAMSAVQFVLVRDGYNALISSQLRAAAETNVPARMEARSWQDKVIILDAAHNPQKLQALCDSVQAKFPGQEVAVMAGFLRGHIRDKVAAITPMADHLIITSFPRLPQDPYESASPAYIAGIYKETGKPYEVRSTVADALEVLLQRPEPILVITGSFYLLNHVRPLLARRHIF